MIDPKMLELSVYDGIPHLLTPVVTDPKKAVVALKWAVREMEDRYKQDVEDRRAQHRRLQQRASARPAKGETITRTVQTGFDRETGEADLRDEEFDLEPMPYIVVIVDEMADLMMVAGKDIEGAVQRLAQMARAAGIHVIMATQRPSVDVITGTIKANFPTRISFQVTSKIDSRTILGEQGAEQLLGQGDMLYMAGGGRIQRVHGPFVSDGEVEKVVAHLKTQGAPEYLDAITADETRTARARTAPATGGSATAISRIRTILRPGGGGRAARQARPRPPTSSAASASATTAPPRSDRAHGEGRHRRPANHAGKREILGQTPLKFLLQPKIDIAKDSKVTDLKRAGADIILSLEDKSTLGGTSRIRVVFDGESYALKEWTVTDPQGNDTRVTLANLNLAALPDRSLFILDEQKILEPKN
jgi:S-DNA-T family DNA segregation ATPase FtsK/SpoIIIE